MNDIQGANAVNGESAGEYVESAETSHTAGRPRRWVRCLVSGWLLFHLAAVIIAPASVGPSSQLVRSGWRLCRPYLQLLYLNHGYHFFAPEPSSSTLVSYIAYRSDGTSVRGQIPDREIQPRLLYHRHFMLTEFFNFAPQETERPWYATYARHLGHLHNAERVSLARKTHYLPTMEAVRNGVKLDNPAGYSEEPLGVFRCDE